MALDIKYLRVMVSRKRHAALLREALRRAKAGEPNATIQAVAEEKFRIAEEGTSK